MKIELEYIEHPNEGERIQKISKILSQGLYSYLRNKGLLRHDPKRKEKAQEAIDAARRLTCRDLG